MSILELVLFTKTIKNIIIVLVIVRKMSRSSSRSSMSSTSPDPMSRPPARRPGAGFSPFANGRPHHRSDISSARSAFSFTPAGRLQKNRRTFSLTPRAYSSTRIRSDPTSRRVRRPRSRNVSYGGSRRVKRGAGAPFLILGGSRRVKRGGATLRPTTINGGR